MANSFQEPPKPEKKFSVYSALYHDDAHLNTFGKTEVVYHPSELENTNSILILHGGADISPSIYNHPVSKFTHADKHMSARDLSEVLLAKRAIELGIPIFGICRGAQLSCALAGGSLIQHVEGHTGGHHAVKATNGNEYVTSTCHHQMMNPWEVDHELLAWSAPSRSTRYIVADDQEIEMSLEPEVVFFPKIKALGIQGHPEWMARSSAFVQYCLSLVKEKLL
jgi:gamma-glutamyl-gamma-aminobutyrate hydrolase PuuD